MEKLRGKRGQELKIQWSNQLASERRRLGKRNWGKSKKICSQQHSGGGEIWETTKKRNATILEDYKGPFGPYLVSPLHKFQI